MIVPQKVVNLYVADRCASRRPILGWSVGTLLYVMGQAAGTAAHLVLTSGGSCAGVDVGALRTLLALDGVYFGTDTRHHSTAEAGRVRA
jgi:FAD dependent oxidoreductase